MTQDEQRAMDALREENASLKQENTMLRQRVAVLEAALAAMQSKVEDFATKLAQNSTNSNKPPSTDGIKKPNRNRSLRQKTGRKPGGQKGHKGSGLSLPEKPDEVHMCAPLECAGCQNQSQCMYSVINRRYVCDVKIQRHVVEYRQQAACCPLRNGERLAGVFPDEARQALQYGPVLTALALALPTECAVSIDRTHRFLKGVSGWPVSTGWVQSVLSSCKGRLKDFMRSLRDRLRKEPVVHFDETWLRTEGKRQYVHNASTKQLTYQVFSEHRGKDGMGEAGVLPGFCGIAVHDGWSPYWLFESVRGHGLCCAHLLREARGLRERHPKSLFFRLFGFLLAKMKEAKEARIGHGKEDAGRWYMTKFMNIYDNLILIGRLEHPIPEAPGRKGRPALGKARSFVERMAKHKGEVCLFFTNFEVPFDNNQAERDQRHVKVKEKVSGCFRTKEGASNFASISSLLGTAKKMGHSALEAFRLMLAGKPEAVLIPVETGVSE